MDTAIDLFAGFGGWTTGGKAAGLDVLWAANHWPSAVEWHSANHPDTKHVCQDLHQADWSQVPKHDVMLASPCCQGHTKARGRESGNPKHDNSRSTAWAPVANAEVNRPEFAVIENVPEFMNWILYPAWADAMQRLGYALAPHIVDCADLGVPQHRVRLFMVCSRSKAAVTPATAPLPARASPRDYRLRRRQVGANQKARPRRVDADPREEWPRTLRRTVRDAIFRLRLWPHWPKS